VTGEPLLSCGPSRWCCDFCRAWVPGWLAIRVPRPAGSFRDSVVPVAAAEVTGTHRAAARRHLMTTRHARAERL